MDMQEVGQRREQLPSASGAVRRAYPSEVRLSAGLTRMSRADFMRTATLLGQLT